MAFSGLVKKHILNMFLNYYLKCVSNMKNIFKKKTMLCLKNYFFLSILLKQLNIRIDYEYRPKYIHRRDMSMYWHMLKHHGCEYQTLT